MTPSDGCGSVVTGFNLILVDVRQFSLIDADMFREKVAETNPKQCCKQEVRMAKIVYMPRQPISGLVTRIPANHIPTAPPRDIKLPKAPQGKARSVAGNHFAIVSWTPGKYPPGICFGQCVHQPRASIRWLCPSGKLLPTTGRKMQAGKRVCHVYAITSRWEFEPVRTAGKTRPSSSRSRLG